MRFARICTAVFAGITAAVLAGAGYATAAEPIFEPNQGRIGLQLSHQETVTLAGGPVPALVTKFVPLNRIGAGLHGDTSIRRDDSGGVHASLRAVILEAAGHPDGTATVYFNAPGAKDGRVLDIYQNWN